MKKVVDIFILYENNSLILGVDQMNEIYYSTINKMTPNTVHSLKSATVSETVTLHYYFI